MGRPVGHTSAELAVLAVDMATVSADVLTAAEVAVIFGVFGLAARVPC